MFKLFEIAPQLVICTVLQLGECQRGRAMPRKDAIWRDKLRFGLPEVFDYGQIRNAGDAKRFINFLPTVDRAKGAVQLYKHRELIGAKAAFAGMMTAWKCDDGKLEAAFGGHESFGYALSVVAPPMSRKRRLQIWRSVMRKAE
jgi:hypothetical protein